MTYPRLPLSPATGLTRHPTGVGRTVHRRTGTANEPTGSDSRPDGPSSGTGEDGWLVVWLVAEPSAGLSPSPARARASCSALGAAPASFVAMPAAGRWCGAVVAKCRVEWRTRPNALPSHCISAWRLRLRATSISRRRNQQFACNLPWFPLVFTVFSPRGTANKKALVFVRQPACR